MNAADPEISKPIPPKMYQRELFVALFIIMSKV